MTAREEGALAPAVTAGSVPIGGFDTNEHIAADITERRCLLLVPVVVQSNRPGGSSRTRRAPYVPAASWNVAHSLDAHARTVIVIPLLRVAIVAVEGDHVDDCCCSLESSRELRCKGRSDDVRDLDSHKRSDGSDRSRGLHSLIGPRTDLIGA